MEFNVYLVEKTIGFKNKASSLDHDYTEDYNNHLRFQGFIMTGYHVTDGDLEIGSVYCTGELIKPIKKVSTFDGEFVGIRGFYK